VGRTCKAVKTAYKSRKLDKACTMLDAGSIAGKNSIRGRGLEKHRGKVTADFLCNLNFMLKGC
jgi:hypothetical protein